MVMRSSNEPDPVAILAALGIENPTSVTSAAGGTSTVLWCVQHAGETYALRVFRPKNEIFIKESKLP